MKTSVRPELPTASVGSSQAMHAAVDNSAPSATRPESTYKSGKVVQQAGPLLIAGEDFFVQILVYDDSTIFGGQQLMGVRAAQSLLSDGATVSFIYFNENKRLEIELKVLYLQHSNLHIVPTSVKSKRAQALRLLFDWIDIIKIISLIRQLRPSIVLAVQGDIEIGSKCLIASRLSGVNVVSYIPFTHSAKKKGLKLAFFRDLISHILYRIPDAFITSAVSVSNKLAYISGRPVRVVRDGIKNLSTETQDSNKEVLRDRFNLPKGKYIAAVAARIQFKQKGQDFLVGVAKRYASELRNVAFLIIGDGPDEEALKMMVRNAGLDSMFVFMPWQDHALTVINAIDLLLIPSVFEGVPLIMLEAMQRRCPVLASCTDGMQEVLPKDMLYKSGDPVDFVRQLKRFVNNELDELGMLLVRNMLIQKEFFSLDKFGHNFALAFKELESSLS